MARPPRGRLLETLTLDTRSAPGVEAAAKSEAHHGMHDMLRGSAWNMLLLTHGSTNKRAPRARGRKWAPGRCLAAPQGRQEHRTDGPPLPVVFSPMAAGGLDGAAPSPRRRRRSVGPLTFRDATTGRWPYS